VLHAARGDVGARPRSGSLTLDSVWMCVDTNNIAAQNNVETRSQRGSQGALWLTHLDGLRFWCAEQNSATIKLLCGVIGRGCERVRGARAAV
jgi:hypothetical protein